jgi:hypothetical protein
MRKHFTIGQIKWIIIICILVELISHIPDLIKGLKIGWNSVQ